jgi:CBS domain-containing protein
MTGGRVRDVMLRSPVVLTGAATVADVRDVLTRTHVHLVLLTPTGAMGEHLLGTLARADVAAADPAHHARQHSSLVDRTVGADLPAEDVRLALLATGRRRAAVVDEHGRLLGLLCLKRRGNGFCTDAGVASRRAARRSEAVRRASGGTSDPTTMVEG